MKRNFIIWALLFFVAHTMSAQWGPRITSPQYNADGSVTFRYQAPEADSVFLSSQILSAPASMQRDADGVWTITVTPDTPDIYPYNFIADGISVSDPSNPLIFPNENFKASLLVMPDKNALYAERRVPRGRVEYRTYRSSVLGENRTLLVYVPAGYDADSDKRYPVYYLVSGTTDTEETWYKVGRANTILDNMIASGEAEPMIVVMPYGLMKMGTPNPSSIAAGEMYSMFEDELFKSIIPYVDENFRTLPDSGHRAIGGFSRGGGQSMFAALRNPGKIGWLASISAYLTPEVMQKYIPALDSKADSLKMCWFCVGDKDFLYKPAVDNMKYFSDKGIGFTYTPHPGHAHTWMHARFALAESLKRLFKDITVTSEGMTIDNSALPGFTVFRPTDMTKAVADNGGEPLPVFVFGNGACSHDSGYYVPMFRHLVANGYVVIAVGHRPGEKENANHSFDEIGLDDNLIDAVDWVCRQAVRPQSPLYHAVNASKIAVGGHSCGGAQALAASYDPRISTTLMLNSGMGDISMAGASAASLADVHAPMLYLIGGPDDIAYGNAEKDYTRIDHVPVYSVNFPVGHGGTFGEDAGGVCGDIVRQWLDWQLKGSRQASRFFTNASFRKSHYPTADFKSKR